MATAKVLVIGGGGGGGGGDINNPGGAGGAGGYQYDAAYTITAGSHSVTVGTGGSGTYNTETAGGDSVFGTITSNGGGPGGTSGQAGGNGASGGGGGGNAGAATGGTRIAGQGNIGGSGVSGGGAGGGGAGAAGADTNNNDGKAGGQGTANSITGTSIGYAGGGGGGGRAGSPGGVAQDGGGDGGIRGGTETGENGTDGLGGGGGGGSSTNSGTANGGTGGKGVVIIAYTTENFSHTGGDATGTSGSETWVKFTSSGTLILTSVERIDITRVAVTDILNRGNATSYTISNAGGNCDAVFAFVRRVDPTSLTGVTYGGIAMTSLVEISDANGHRHSVWGLRDCYPGTQDLIASSGNSTQTHIGIATYKGVSRTATFPNASNSGKNLLASLTVSVTTTVDSCVLIGIGGHTGLAADEHSPGTGTSRFSLYNNSSGYDDGALESNPLNAGDAGSKSLQITLGSSGQDISLAVVAVTPSTTSAGISSPTII